MSRDGYGADYGTGFSRMEVFFCVADYWAVCPRLSRLRYNMANTCHAAWELMPGVTVEVLSGKGREWQSKRRQEAESRATGEVYCCADDDCLPGFSSVDDLIGLFRAYPDFAILSAWPSNCDIQRWTPEGYRAHHGPDIEEHVSVGGIRFVRKGAQAEWPPQEGNWYDRTQADWLREHGWRVGLLTNKQCIHLGEGFSTL